MFWPGDQNTARLGEVGPREAGGSPPPVARRGQASRRERGALRGAVPAPRAVPPIAGPRFCAARLHFGLGPKMRGAQKKGRMFIASGPICLRCVLRRVEILKMFAANLEYILIIPARRENLLRIHVRSLKKSRIFSEQIMETVQNLSFSVNFSRVRNIRLQFLPGTAILSA